MAPKKIMNADGSVALTGALWRRSGEFLKVFDIAASIRRWMEAAVSQRPSAGDEASMRYVSYRVNTFYIA